MDVTVRWSPHIAAIPPMFHMSCGCHAGLRRWVCSGYADSSPEGSGLRLLRTYKQLVALHEPCSER